MMNPDLMYILYQQRHQQLWAEAEQARAQRELSPGNREPPLARGMAAPFGRASSARRYHHLIGKR